MDKIILNDLRFYGYHGALPEENVLGQEYITSVTLEVDTRTAGETDELNQTIDYRKAITVIREVVTGPSLKLIETITHRIACRLLEELPMARAVTVRLSKPRPPVGVDLSGVTIEIRRERVPG